jgi:hypothetical protein
VGTFLKEVVAAPRLGRHHDALVLDDGLAATNRRGETIHTQASRVVYRETTVSSLQIREMVMLK